MKAQEREMIDALIQSEKSKVTAQSSLLAAWLAEQKLQMSDFATATLNNGLKGGFSGKAATNYLTNIPQPNLQTPIK